MIHGVYSTFFGRREWDLGKTIRWHQFLVDTGFVVDANVYQSVDWDLTYPGLPVALAPQRGPLASPEALAEWRAYSFARADAHHRFSDDDWVLFLDGSEQLNVNDEGTPTLDLLEEDPDPFLKWLRSEVLDAEEVDVDMVWLPFYVYVRESQVRAEMVVTNPDLEVPFEGDLVPLGDAIATVLARPASPERNLLLEELSRVGSANQHVAFRAVPWYFHESMALPRLVKVSRLRDPAMDWAALDDPFAGLGEYTAGLHGIISYAYARWAPDRSKWDATAQTAANEAADEGFAMRRMISNVRPLPGLPTTWSEPDTALLVDGPDLVDGSGDPAAPEVRTPAYQSTFRQDPLAGVVFRGTRPEVPAWDVVNDRPAVPA